MSSTGQYTVNNLRIMVVLTVLLTVNSDYMLHKTNYERVGVGGKLLLYICMIAAALVFTAAGAGGVCWQMVGDVRAPVPGQVRGPQCGTAAVQQHHPSSSNHPAWDR